LLPKIPQEIIDILHYELLGNPLSTWLSALGIFLVFIVLRYRLIQLLVLFFKKMAQKTETTLDDKIVDVLERPLQLAVVFIGLYLSLSIFKMTETVNIAIKHAISSVFIFLGVWIAYRALIIFNENLVALSRHFHSELGESLVKLIISALKALVVVIGAIILFNEWGFNVTGFLASLGLVGMAFALAAKDTASNLFGSLVIFSDRPFNIGDWIKTPEVEGTVEEIGIRSTRVRTFAQALVSVPNGSLANSAILNWSRMGKRRIKMTVGLTYSTTSVQMQNILAEMRELLRNDPGIHPDTIFIHFTDFQESALGIFCYFFTNTTNWGEYMAVRERINLAIMQIVEQNGASFAFPSQSLYIESMPEPAME
jgi:MscS family membrane protein